MNYTNVYNSIIKHGSICLSNDQVETIETCIRNYWSGNYFRTSDETQDEVEHLEKNLGDQLTKKDIETMCWLLYRYDYEDVLEELYIKNNNEEEDFISTDYIG